MTNKTKKAYSAFRSPSWQSTFKTKGGLKVNPQNAKEVPLWECSIGICNFSSNDPVEIGKHLTGHANKRFMQQGRPLNKVVEIPQKASPKSYEVRKLNKTEKDIVKIMEELGANSHKNAITQKAIDDKLDVSEQTIRKALTSLRSIKIVGMVFNLTRKTERRFFLK